MSKNPIDDFKVSYKNLILYNMSVNKHNTKNEILKRIAKLESELSDLKELNNVNI